MTDEGAAAAPDPPPEVFGARAASSDPPLGEFGAGATPSDQPSPAPPDPSAPAAPPEPPFAPGLAGPPATARAGPNPDPASVAGSGREAYAGLVSRLLALAVDAALLAIVVPVVGVLAPGLWSAVAGSAPEWLRVCSGVLA